MDGFLTRFERPLADSEPDNTFDEIIDMDPREDSRQNLETVVNALHKSFPKLVPTLPTSEEMDNAINASLNDYSPQLKHDLSFGGNKKDKNNNNNKQKQGGAADKLRTKDRKVEYFAIKLLVSPSSTAWNRSSGKQDLPYSGTPSRSPIASRPAST